MKTNRQRIIEKLRERSGLSEADVTGACRYIKNTFQPEK